MGTQAGKPRVLIFSLRNISKALFRCPLYEFEDLICEMDSAVLFAPKVDPTSALATLATRLAYHAPVMLNPGVRSLPKDTRYELFFAVCGFPRDLLMVNAVNHVKEICSTSVCLLDELWIK